MMKRRQIFKSSVGYNKGFTMIELVAVLVVMGIIVAVAAVRMSGRNEYDLASQVEVVKSHLRLAQSRAMTTGTQCGINFNSTTTYNLFTGTATTTGLLLPGEDNETVALTTKKSGLTITSAPQTVTFDAHGSPGTTLVTVRTSGGDINITKNTGFIQ